MERKSKVELIEEGGELFVVVDNVKAARREDGEWRSLIPGVTITEEDGELVITKEGSPKQ